MYYDFSNLDKLYHWLTYEQQGYAKSLINRIIRYGINVANGDTENPEVAELFHRYYQQNIQPDIDAYNEWWSIEQSSTIERQMVLRPIFGIHPEDELPKHPHVCTAKRLLPSDINWEREVVLYTARQSTNANQAPNDYFLTQVAKTLSLDQTQLTTLKQAQAPNKQPRHTLKNLYWEILHAIYEIEFITDSDLIEYELTEAGSYLRFLERRRMQLVTQALHAYNAFTQAITLEKVREVQQAIDRLP